MQSMQPMPSLQSVPSMQPMQSMQSPQQQYRRLLAFGASSGGQKRRKRWFEEGYDEQQGLVGDPYEHQYQLK